MFEYYTLQFWSKHILKINIETIIPYIYYSVEDDHNHTTHSLSLLSLGPNSPTKIQNTKQNENLVDQAS